MTIAQTILTQLGGNRFIAMTGAKQFVDHGSALVMTLPSSITKGRSNRLMITLNGNDLYDIKIGRYRNYEITWSGERFDIGVENLRSTFTELTGLDTSLGNAGEAVR